MTLIKLSFTEKEGRDVNKYISLIKPQQMEWDHISIA